MNRILVVDDDHAIRLLYEEELSDEGYRVFTTDDYTNLMDTIKQHMPDLIILDVKLRQFSGLDILQDIRNKYHKMPVILCSAYPTFRNDMKSIAADYYVTKSAHLDELKQTIKTALGAQRPVPDFSSISGSEEPTPA